MGLDMYLYIDKYVSRMDYSRDADGNLATSVQPAFQALTDTLGVHDLIKQDDWTGYTVSVPVGYWRKANAIHNWIVTFCADGEDNCQRIYVRRERAEELVHLCKQVLADHSKADELLPTASGFFFGGLEYDDWYFEDIQKTIDIFEPLLADDMLADSIWYQASW